MKPTHTSTGLILAILFSPAALASGHGHDEHHAAPAAHEAPATAHAPAAAAPTGYREDRTKGNFLRPVAAIDEKTGKPVHPGDLLSTSIIL